MAEKEPTVPPGWNTNKPGGWEAFKEAGEKYAENIADIVEDEGYSCEEMMEKIEDINTKMKWIAFGKTKPRTKTATNKETVAETTDELKGKELLTKLSERMEAETLKIKEMKQGRATKVYKMREVIKGKKKVTKEASAIYDFRTNDLVVMYPTTK